MKLKPFDIIFSDPHWYHHNIVELCGRPFEPGYHMTEELIKRFNEKSSEEAIVYCLGDFSLSASAVGSILPRLKYKEIHLLCGNHDKCWKALLHPELEGQRHWIQDYKDWGFTSLGLEEVMEIEGRQVSLGHLPYRGSGDHSNTERYSQQRPVDKGIPRLHGHRHSKPEEKIRYTSRGTLMLDLGVDGNEYYPYTYEEVVKLIEDNLDARSKFR